jgi:hypothetical protein
MPSPAQRYTSYLLRLWWTDDPQPHACRVALESTQAGERWTFSDLDSLLAFLKTQAGAPDVTHGETHA